MLSYIRKLVKHQKNHYLTTTTVAMKQLRNLKKPCRILLHEPIVACFNDPQCNNPVGDDADEWMINENAVFDYPESVGLLKSIDLPPKANV